MQTAKARIFKRDAHFLYQGDALDVLDSKISDASIDLIFADPPCKIGKR